MAIHVILKGKIQEQGPIAHAQVGRSSSVALTLVNFLQAFLVVFNQKLYVHRNICVCRLICVYAYECIISNYVSIYVWVHAYMDFVMLFKAFESIWLNSKPRNLFFCLTTCIFTI